MPIYFLRGAYIHFAFDSFSGPQRDAIFFTIGLFLIIILSVCFNLYVYFEHKRRSQNIFNKITELKLKVVIDIIKLNEKNSNPENWEESYAHKILAQIEDDQIMMD